MASPATRPDNVYPARWHPANAVSLVFGLVFCGLAGGWFLLDAGILAVRDVGWAFPTLVTGAGLVGVLVSIFRVRSRGEDT